MEVDDSFLNLIHHKISSNITFNKIIELILDRIEVSKGKEITLKIYLVFHNNTLFIQDNYTFKRGYDAISTKRYHINYHIIYLDIKKGLSPFFFTLNYQFHL